LIDPVVGDPVQLRWFVSAVVRNLGDAQSTSYGLACSVKIVPSVLRVDVGQLPPGDVATVVA